MRTNLPGVFAAGDVTLEHMWTDVAYMERVVAAENAMGREAGMDYSVVPYWTCSVPNIAGVGLTEDGAIKIRVRRKGSPLLSCCQRHGHCSGTENRHAQADH
jgi:dihydrolipoamide dehydrogenase